MSFRSQKDVKAKLGDWQIICSAGPFFSMFTSICAHNSVKIYLLGSYVYAIQTLCLYQLSAIQLIKGVMSWYSTAHPQITVNHPQIAVNLMPREILHKKLNQLIKVHKVRD